MGQTKCGHTKPVSLGYGLCISPYEQHRNSCPVQSDDTRCGAIGCRQVEDNAGPRKLFVASLRARPCLSMASASSKRRCVRNDGLEAILMRRRTHEGQLMRL